MQCGIVRDGDGVRAGAAHLGGPDPGGSHLVAGPPATALQLAVLLDELGHPPRHLGRLDAKRPRRLPQLGFALLPAPLGGLPRHQFDAPDPLADGTLGDDHHGADVAAPLHMGAAAQLTGPAPEVHDADLRAVFLAEEGHRPLGAGFVHIRHGDTTREIVANGGIDPPLDGAHLLRGQPAGEAEVEGGSVRAHEGSTLDRPLPQGLLQGLVQEMGGAVVPGDLPAAQGVDTGGQPLPAAQ